MVSRMEFLKFGPDFPKKPNSFFSRMTGRERFFAFPPPQRQRWTVREVEWLTEKNLTCFIP